MEKNSLKQNGAKADSKAKKIQKLNQDIQKFKMDQEIAKLKNQVSVLKKEVSCRKFNAQNAKEAHDKMKIKFKELGRADVQAHLKLQNQQSLMKELDEKRSRMENTIKHLKIDLYEERNYYDNLKKRNAELLRSVESTKAELIEMDEKLAELVAKHEIEKQAIEQQIHEARQAGEEIVERTKQMQLEIEQLKISKSSWWWSS